MHRPVKRFLSGITAAMLAFSCSLAKPVSSFAADPDYKSWMQTDSRWGSKTMGGGYATVADVGCLATSIAILAVHSGAVTSDSFNPGTFVDSMNDIGGFDYSGSLANWNSISEVIPSLQCEGKYCIDSSTDESEYIEILKNLDEQGYYSICYVGHHWVLVDYIDGDNVYMCDPGSSSTDMLSAYPFSSYTHDTIRYFSIENSSPSEQPDNGDITDIPQDNQNYKEGVYKITASTLNVRENPNIDSEAITFIPNGENVTVTEFSDGWGRTSYNGYEGWIYMEYAEYIAPEAITTSAVQTQPEITETTTVTTVTSETHTMIVSTFNQPNAEEYTVISETAQITDCAGDFSDVLCTVPKNTIVKVKSINQDYAEIFFGNSTAIISLRDIAPVPDNEIFPEKGDVNCDGVVNKLDISYLNECIRAENEFPDKISLLTQKGRYAADFNYDGEVNNDDVIQLIIAMCNF